MRRRCRHEHIRATCPDLSCCQSCGGRHARSGRDALDIEVDKAAWLGVLIADHRLWGMRSFIRGRSARLRTRLTMAGDMPTSIAICLPFRRWRRSAMIRAASAAAVCFGLTFGRDELSIMPARPWPSKRRLYSSLHVTAISLYLPDLLPNMSPNSSTADGRDEFLMGEKHIM